MSNTLRVILYILKLHSYFVFYYLVPKRSPVHKYYVCDITSSSNSFSSALKRMKGSSSGKFHAMKIYVYIIRANDTYRANLILFVQDNIMQYVSLINYRQLKMAL